MKRFFSLLLAAACLIGCGLLYRHWIQPDESAPLIGFISTAPSETPDPFAQVRLTLEEDGIQTQRISACTDLTQAVQQLTQAGAQVIIFHIAGTLPDTDFTAAARQAGVAMIFAGQAPVRALNTQYDKIWYLGSIAANAGELIGQQVAAAFRSGSLPDADGDLLLDYIALSDGTDTAAEILAAAKWECEHYGVSGSDCESTSALSRGVSPAEEAALVEQWASLAQKPEIIFCIGSDYAKAAYQAAAQLGWLNGDAPVLLAAVTENEATALQLLELGGFCGLAHYDEAAQTQALYAMTHNLLAQRDVAFGTELRRSITEPRFDLPYVALAIEPPTPTADSAAE